MKDEPNIPPHTDHYKYIEGIRNHNTKVIQEIYDEHLHVHIQWVKTNNGTVEDGHDNFQDALEVIVRKIFFSPFILPCSFAWYFHGVAHNLWLKKLRKKKTEKKILEELVRKMQTEEYMSKQVFEKLIEETINGDRWVALLERTFQKISPVCQKLLKLYQEGKDVKTIAIEMDKQPSTIHHRKHVCIKSWRKAMIEDPDFIDSNPYKL